MLEKGITLPFPPHCFLVQTTQGESIHDGSILKFGASSRAHDFGIIFKCTMPNVEKKWLIYFFASSFVAINTIKNRAQAGWISSVQTRLPLQCSFELNETRSTTFMQ